MKKKNVILIIVGLVLVVGMYFGYKSYYYFKYIPDALESRKNYIDILKIDDTIKVKTENINPDDYFQVNNIKIRNDFKDFELSDKFINDENAKGYILKDSDGNSKTAISLGKDTLFNIVESLDKTESLLDTKNKTNIWVKDYAKNLNINNDLDLLMHIINNKDKTPNIFSSKHDIIFYAYEYIVLNLYPIPEKITLIEGDLSGYILELKEPSAYEVHLFNGLDKYSIVFWNKEYFTYDYIKELLSTIKIENNYEETFTKITINEKEMNINIKDYNTLNRIFDKLNYNLISCSGTPMYTIKIGGKTYKYDRHNKKVSYNDKCANIEGENLEKSINILEWVYSNNEMNNIENVKMEIKEGTLTKTDATIIITDTNKEHYEYGQGFRIDKKENGTWKEAKLIGEAVFILPAYLIDENNKLELVQSWKHIYGELNSGTYRLVKSVCVNTGCYEQKYFSVEFNIE